MKGITVLTRTTFDMSENPRNRDEARARKHKSVKSASQSLPVAAIERRRLRPFETELRREGGGVSKGFIMPE
jgi:hypothetical protein